MTFVLLMIVATATHGLYFDFNLDTFVDILGLVDRQALITKLIATFTLARQDYMHTDYCFIAHSQNN